MATLIQKRSWEHIPLESIEQEIRDAYSSRYSIHILDYKNEINISIDFENWCDDGRAATYIETIASSFTREERTLEQVLECIRQKDIW